MYRTFFCQCAAKHLCLVNKQGQFKYKIRLHNLYCQVFICSVSESDNNCAYQSKAFRNSHSTFRSDQNSQMGTWSSADSDCASRDQPVGAAAMFLREWERIYLRLHEYG